MRHILHLFLATLALTALLLAASCRRESPVNPAETDFIYMEDNEFKLHGETFFPLMLNYF